MNLIPFGLRSDGVYIDAEDATRGKSCGCTCPSCGIALIARQGDVNASHFAHDSKGASKEDIEACKYSFYVSVRYMLKQLLQGTGLLMLPPLEIDHHGQTHVITKSLPITVEPKDITPDSYEQDIIFDLIFTVSGRKLCLYISHPGRPAPIYNNLSRDQHTAVLGLDLIPFSKIFNEFYKLKSAQTLLREWLETSIKGKHWIYNPRRNAWFEHQQAKAPAVQEPQQVQEQTKTTRDRIKEQIAKMDRLNVVAIYRCVFCQLDFEGSALLNYCPKCNDHLSVKRKSEIAAQTPHPPKGKYRYR